MKIYNELNEEISEEDIDLSKGYLIEDFIITKEYAPITREIKKFHYEPVIVFFNDNSKILTSIEDPNIKIINKFTGQFDYLLPKNENNKKVLHISVQKIPDSSVFQEYTPAPEVQAIQRYILYTPEDFKNQKREKELTDFQLTGPNRLKENEAAINDLTLSMAEMLGVM